MNTPLPNPLPTSWVGVLRSLAEYSYLVRPQLSQLLFAEHRSTRYCRKVLSDLGHHGMVAKTHRKITYDNTRSGCPVYYLTEKGIERLAEATEDVRYLKATRQPPRNDRLEHWCQSSEVHLTLDRAIAAQDYVQAPVWINEWNRCRADGHDQFYLHVQFQTEPTKLSCSPDGAFLLLVAGLLQPYYVETDLGSSSPPQVIHRKQKGYEMLAATDMHRTRHFPQLEPGVDFRILVVTTTRWRRDRMAAIARSVPGAHRWRFIAFEDLRPEWLLHERVLLDTEGELRRLVKPPTGYHEAAPVVTLEQRKRQRIEMLDSDAPRRLTHDSANGQPAACTTHDHP